MSFKEGHVKTHGEEIHTTMEAEIGVKHLQAEEGQGWPATNHQKLGKRHRTDSPSEPSEKSSLADTLISLSPTVRQCISVAWNHQVHGSL